MRRHALIPVTAALLAVGFTLLVASCSKNSADNVGPVDPALLSAVPAPVSTSAPFVGRATEMPSYYDSALFNINFSELPANAETALLAHNKSINHIYEMDPDQPDNQPFIPVLDAIQGDGFNPLWVEVEITFNSGFTPHQFYSDNQVLAAAAATPPEISLTTTNEVYRCSVLGSKK